VEPDLKRRLIWGLVVLLAVLHYDFWAWNDASLVFGFMPMGLFYQAMISVAAAVCWLLMVKYAWPTHVEEWADATDDGPGRRGREDS
jgi:hypothetical protein